MESTFDSSRRSFLQSVGGVIAASAVAPFASADTLSPTIAASVALSDRAMGMRQNLGAFAIARDLGATGVELDFGRLGARRELDTRLSRPAGRRLFDLAAMDSGVPLVSLRLGALSDISLADDPRWDAVSDDFLQTLHAGSIRVGVLPLGRTGDLGGAGVRAPAIGRLTAFCRRAEQAGVTLAIDADLPPADLAELLDQVGSPDMKACVSDVETFRAVGVKRVAQVRFRYDGVDPVARAVDLNALRRATAAAGWQGWIVIDRPAVAGSSTLDDARRAVRQVRSIFA